MRGAADPGQDHKDPRKEHPAGHAKAKAGSQDTTNPGDLLTNQASCKLSLTGKVKDKSNL